ncbi:polyprenyl synthetase family protein, partial [Streptomyces sp. SID8455]|nr:polyprenyl synthetase family protein [Streptomyces sp. SID8455]
RDHAVRRLGEAVDVDAHGGRQLLGLLRTVSGDSSGDSPDDTRGHERRGADRDLTAAEGGHVR